MGKTRTAWDLILTVAIPFSRWGASPYICSPIPLPADIIAQLVTEIQEESSVQKRRPHPFEMALLWRQQMRDDTALSKAKLAAREGLSRARVTQIMALLDLPKEIQSGLLNPPPPLKIHNFSERSLRVIVSCGGKKPKYPAGATWFKNAELPPAAEPSQSGLLGFSPCSEHPSDLQILVHLVHNLASGTWPWVKARQCLGEPKSGVGRGFSLISSARRWTGTLPGRKKQHAGGARGIWGRQGGAKI